MENAWETCAKGGLEPPIGGKALPRLAKAA